MAVHGESFVLSGGAGVVAKYDLRTGRPVWRCSQHQDVVRDLSLSGDGRLLASASDDRTAIVRDTGTGQLLARIHHGSKLTRIELSQPGDRLIIASRDGLLRLYSSPDGREIRSYHAASSVVSPVHFMPDAGTVLAGYWDGATRLLSLDSGAVLRTFVQPGHAWLDDVAASDDGQFVVTASHDGYLRVFSSVSSELLQCVKAHTGRFRGLLLKGETAFTGGYDGLVKKWDWRRGKLLESVAVHRDSVTVIRMTCDGKRLFTASRDGTLCVFGCATRLELLARLHFFSDGGFLWTTPPDQNVSESGWFFTDKPQSRLQVFSVNSTGNCVSTLSPDELRCQSYVSTHNNREMVLAAIGSTEERRRLDAEYSQLIQLYSAENARHRLLTRGKRKGHREK